MTITWDDMADGEELSTLISTVRRFLCSASLQGVTLAILPYCWI